MIYIIMGVSGSGKTTIGQKLKEKLTCNFYDADDFHPPENIEKMRQGIPLNDGDRYPWLMALSRLINKHQQSQTDAIITCSALKQTYRDLLQNNHKNVIWIYLKGTYEQILERMEQREGHFMKSEMLRSQFETLEEPDNAVVIDISLFPQEIIEQILSFDLCTGEFI